MIGITFTIAIDGESNKEFIEKIYKKYNRLMFSTAHHYLSNLNDREDVVQDAIVHLCGKVDLLRTLPDHALPAYITYTTKNVAINHLRHQAVVDKYMQLLADDNIDAQSVTPQDYTLLAELKTDLAKVWACLSEQDQELLYRKYIFGQDNVELANIFRCREDTLRMRLSRARKRAVKLIKEEGIYEKT